MSRVSTYDEVAFPSYPYPPSHPARLATIAKLSGLNPPPVDTCRVLEIGCGAGGNLLSLREALPGSDLVGIDRSQQQIDVARDLVTAASLERVRLEAADIEAWASGQDKFDFIVAHGLFSWTTDSVRERILEIIQSSLSENGVAYVNFNTYPGWHLQSLLRDMIAFPAQDLANPDEKVEAARRIMELMNATLPPPTSPYGAIVRNELDSIRRNTGPFIFHAYLNVVNQPLYLHEFERRAAGHELMVFGDAEPQLTWPLIFEPQLAGAFRHYSQDASQWPQLYDFARSTSSRRSLLCHTGAPVQREPSAEMLQGIYVSARLEKRREPATGAQFVTASGKKVQTSQTRLIQTLEILSDAWPESRTIAELEADPAIGGPPDNAVQAWRMELLQCFCHGILDLSVWQPPVIKQLSSRPRATAFARAQASRMEFVTNLRHQAVRPSAADLACLALCDGAHTVEQIRAELGGDATTALQRLNADCLLMKD